MELAQHSLWWEESGKILLVDEGQRRTCPLITALTIRRSSLRDIQVPWSECMGSLCLALKKLAGMYAREPGTLAAVHANLPKGHFCSPDQSFLTISGKAWPEFLCKPLVEQFSHHLVPEYFPSVRAPLTIRYTQIVTGPPQCTSLCARCISNLLICLYTALEVALLSP